MPVTGFILDDIENLRESAAVEFKLAAGRHGKGALSQALWESYSAFANTNGGEIILGVREEKGEFYIEGIAEPRPLIDEAWKILNNSQKISANILGPADIQLIELAGKQLIRFHVPQADYSQQPIYLGTEAIGGTYIRVGDADMRASPAQVKRMLRRKKRHNAQASHNSKVK
ncbi:AlbA family DNA-binding domain-containing protein [Shewanella indica]|uniref:AlbA family DNA-binding domain-containing protein n=1 Tax=Shewanella indica TaxID=768528 RepID=UPI001CFC92C3|nr:ATP-binding protein [Shewanella indica]